MHAMQSSGVLIVPVVANNRGDTPFCSEECRYHQMVRDDHGAGESMRSKTKRPTMTEERRRRHEAPDAAEPARVPLAANVPVAI